MARDSKFRALKREYDEIFKLEREGKWPPHSISKQNNVHKSSRPQSAAIDKEKQALEKMKLKQQ